ncbi:MAG: AAA family ATPase [Alphaproteobacteria bacterium]
MSALRAWLDRHGLGKYAELFAENDIGLDVLPDLTDADLEKLGVSLGDRRRILKAAASVEGADKSPGPPVPPRAETREAERRQLTVVFCDLVGSTELSIQLDPEDFREVVKVYQEACAAVVARFEGHIAKYLGDGLLIYFGYPQAHEDDAERAVHAALGIVKAVSTLEPRPGLSLATRVGIATGRVVAGDLVGERVSDEQVVLGDVPNLAARLQGVADPDTVVISDTTRRLAGGVFDYGDLGARSLKGITEPVQVWRAVSERALESRFEARHGQLTEFVGREHEIGLLLDRWKLAKSGEGQVVLLSGGAGIGKSRIAQTLRERLAGEPCTRVRYQCSPHHTNSALYPAIRQIEFAAGFAAEDTNELRLAKLESLLTQSSQALPDVVPFVATLLSIPTDERYPTPDLPSQRQRETTLHVLAELFVGLSTREPVLFLIEDTHWIDPTTQELVDLIVARVADLPALVVITFRPEYAPPWSGHSHVTSLTLNRLSRGQSAAIVGAITAGTELPNEVLDQIVEKSDGVPLFVEELTKSVIEAGYLEERFDRYVLTAPLPSLAVPVTLQDALAARLDRVSQGRDVAQIGAAIGREFSHALMASICDLPGVELSEALDRLVGSGLIFRRGTPPDATYAFKHALVQDAAYESLLRGARQRLHERIARALEELFPGTVEAEPELLAHHLTEAGRAEDAISYWYEAGRRASERSANMEAVAHLQAGLTLLGDLPETPERDRQELDLRMTLGPPLMFTEGFASADVERTYLRARELCEREGEPSQLFVVLWGLWLCNQQRGNVKIAQGLTREILALSETLRDPGFRLQAHHAAWTTELLHGDLRVAHEHAKHGIELYDPAAHSAHAYVYGGHDPGLCCMSTAAYTLWFLGFPDQARDGTRDAIALARSLSHPLSLIISLVDSLYIHCHRREPGVVREVAREAISLCTEHGNPNYAAIANMLSGWAMAVEGEAKAGIGQIERGLADFKALGFNRRLPFYLALLADVLARAGKVDEGLDTVSKALELVERTGEHSWEAEIHRMRGELLLRASSGGGAGAEACFERALAIAREQGTRSLELRAATSLARLWQTGARRDTARDLLAPVYNWFTEGFGTRDLKDAKALLDELA